MAFEPSPQQALLIFSMLLGENIEQREPAQSQRKCGLAPAARDVLVRKKFLKKVPPEGRGPTRLALADEGREWALRNLFCRLPERGNRPKAILARLNEALMPILNNRWDEVERRLFPNGASHPAEPEPEFSDDITVESIQGQIRDAYLSLTGGRTKERVLFSALRPKVPVVSDDFDQAVLSLQAQQKVVLAGLDNPVERTPEVEAAAIHIAGNARHLLYFQG